MIRREVHIGECRLLLGDCLEILPMLGKVDAVVTDPPYGVDFKYATHIDSAENYSSLITPVFEWAFANANTTITAVCIKNISAFPAPKWVLAWNKPGSMTRNALGGFNIWEPIFVYGKARFVDDAVWLPNCVNYNKDEASGHPCPKPLALYRWLVERGTAHGTTVLDPFLGSGTTLVACAKLGRKGIGIEIDETYFDIACRRISEAYRQPSLFAEPTPQLKQEVLFP